MRWARLGYAGYFSYETILHHRSVLSSSFDLGLEDNLLWNLIHGGSFMKMAPLCGPTCTHFGNHATLFAYFIAPFYALYQHAEALLVFQAVLVGFAALPLFLFAARQHRAAGRPASVALAYLLEIRRFDGANLGVDSHYPPLGAFSSFGSRCTWSRLSTIAGPRSVSSSPSRYAKTSRPTWPRWASTSDADEPSLRRCHHHGGRRRLSSCS